MFISKLKYKLARIFNKFSLDKLNFSDIFVNLFYFIVIIFLGLNIFTTFNKGMEDLRKFQAEQTKLKGLQEENVRLQKELERYGSIEYKS